MAQPPSAEPHAAIQRPSWVRYVVLGWLCLAAAIAYVQRNSIGVVESTIRKELEISEPLMGLAMAAFFISYAAFQLPSGWVGHVLGTRHALSAFALAWSAISGLLGLVHGFFGLLFVRFGMGAAQAGIFPCSANSITLWIPERRRSLASGALACFMSVGGALGPALAGQFMPQLGWRLMFALFAVPGIIWAICFWLWFRDDPRDHPAVNADELALLEREATRPAAQSSVLSREPVPPALREPVPPSLREPVPPSPREPVPWREILSSPAMWWIGGQQFFRAAGYIFFGTWFATYLQKTRGVSVELSGWLTALPLLAVVLGSLLGGVMSDWLLAKTGSRRIARQLLAAVSMAICGVLVFVAYGIPQAETAVAVISIGSFFSAIAGPCAYTITMDLGGRHVTTVFSFMNMCGNIGASAFPFIVPWIVIFFGNWDSVLFLFGGINFAAAICWLCFRAQESIVKPLV